MIITAKGDISIHDEGTKFYSVIVVEFEGVACLIKHWGKYTRGADIGVKNFGQCQIETHDTVRAADASARARMRNKAKHGTWAILAIDISAGRCGVSNASDIAQYAARHFPTKINHAMLLHFVEAMERSAKIKGVEPDFIIVDEPFIVKSTKAQPAVVIDRGESWGTW